jgi:pimeloyl-ACP methyl ester carboxylesterase
MSTEFPTWIDCPAGKMFAIVHEPDPQIDNGTAIVMPNAGQDSRTGPQRIYVRAARHFAAAGFRVVRLDLPGTGDSRADNPKIALDSHAAENVSAGVHWAIDRWGVKNLYLVALCAGARAAFRYAAHDSVVDGVVAWSVPTLSDGGTPYLNAQGMKRAFSSGSLFTAAWWKNRRENGIREIRQFSTMLFVRLKNALGLKRESYFIRCLDKYLKEGRPAQFLFGSLDKIICSDFAERFPQVQTARLERQGVWIIPDAVHALSSVAAHEAAIELSRSWIEHRIGVSAGATGNEQARISRESATAA